MILKGLSIGVECLSVIGQHADLIGSLVQAGVYVTSRLVQQPAAERIMVSRSASVAVSRFLSDIDTLRLSLRHRKHRNENNLRLLATKDYLVAGDSTIDDLQLATWGNKSESNLNYTEVSGRTYSKKRDEDTETKLVDLIKPSEEYVATSLQVVNLGAELYSDNGTKTSHSELNGFRSELEKDKQPYDVLFKWQHALDEIQDRLVNDVNSELDKLATSLNATISSMAHLDVDKIW